MIHKTQEILFTKCVHDHDIFQLDAKRLAINISTIIQVEYILENIDKFVNPNINSDGIHKFSRETRDDSIIEGVSLA